MSVKKILKEMLVQVITYGVIIALITAGLSIYIAKVEYKWNSKAQVEKGFCEELVELNRAMIRINYKVQSEGIQDVNEIISLLKDNVEAKFVDVIAYNDSYAIDLEEYAGAFELVEKNWAVFAMTTEVGDMGEKLDEFKESISVLITMIRNNN